MLAIFSWSVRESQGALALSTTNAGMTSWRIQAEKKFPPAGLISWHFIFLFFSLNSWIESHSIWTGTKAPPPERPRVEPETFSDGEEFITLIRRCPSELGRKTWNTLKLSNFFFREKLCRQFFGYQIKMINEVAGEADTTITLHYLYQNLQSILLFQRNAICRIFSI